MSITVKNNLGKLLSILGNITGYAASSKEAEEQDKDCFLQLEYQREYGGYRLVIVKLPGYSYETYAFGFSDCTSRVNAATMERQLQGLIKGISWAREQETKTQQTIQGLLNKLG